MLLAALVGLGASACDDETTGEGGARTTPTASGGGTGGTGGSTGTGGATTSTTTTSDGGAEAGWAEPPPTLNNDAECTWPIALTPNAGEEGHLIATRLTPPSYPFEVDEVHYELMGDDPCDSSFAHRVEVFVDSTVAPPNSPNITQLDVPAAVATESVRVVKLTLPSPITLQSGEHLFVAVELPTADTSCVATCDGAGDWERDYWSNATSTPYSWAALSTFNMFAHARIGANGTAQ